MRDMFSLKLIIFGALAVGCVAQLPGNFGSCPEHPTLHEFDLNKFQGTWYEIERTFYVYELLGNCPKFDFRYDPAEQVLNVAFSMKNRITKKNNLYQGIAHLNRYNPAIWDYRVSTNLPKAIARIMPGSGKYYILDTDYDNYAIMYSCSNFGFIHYDQTWVLGRQKTLAPESRSIIYTLLSNLNIDENRLTLSKHSNCD